MNDWLGRVVNFETQIFKDSADLYGKLSRDGQSPKALMISCSDSRVVPEQIMQAEPGELFVCRNAGNIVPPYATQNGGVTSTVEYAVMVLGIKDIIVCGHSDCGAMKALGKDLSAMPNVAVWLEHSVVAYEMGRSAYADLDEADRVRAVSLENVVAQLAHLRTHPSVAVGIAKGEITLHGWFVDIHAGQVLGLDGGTGKFTAMREGKPLPVALAPQQRLAAGQVPVGAAVE